MFGVSGGELIILLVIGLIVLGPERLPRVANQIGGWLGQARRMTRVMKRQLEEELDLNETLNINPPSASRTPSTQPDNAQSETSTPAESEQPLPRDDDDYSPVHDTDEIGTGVDDALSTDEAIVDADDLAGAQVQQEPPGDSTTNTTTDSAGNIGDKQPVTSKSS